MAIPQSRRVLDLRVYFAGKGKTEFQNLLSQHSLKQNFRFPFFVVQGNDAKKLQTKKQPTQGHTQKPTLQIAGVSLSTIKASYWISQLMHVINELLQTLPTHAV